MFRGIRSKLLFSMGLIVLLVFSILTYFYLTSQFSIIRTELESRKQVMIANLEDQSLILSKSIQTQAEADVADKELFKLMQKVDLLIANNHWLTYAILHDESGLVYLNTLRPELEQLTLEQTKTTPPGKSVDPVTQISVVHATNEKGEGFIEYHIPIHDQRDEFYYLRQLSGEQVQSVQDKDVRPWGKIILGFTTQRLQKDLAESQAYYASKTEDVVIKTFFMALITLTVTYAVISPLSRRLTDPIVALTHQSEQIAKGNFAHQSNTNQALNKIYASDEIGMLTKRFYSMAENLRESYGRLAEYNETLEKMVEDRTKELKINNDELQRTLSDLEESQQQLIHAEKMAALGQLIAGIAHEINTPLGAIQATVGNTSKSVTKVIDNLPAFLASTTGADIAYLKSFFSEKFLNRNLTSREKRAERRAITRYFQERNVDHAEQIADMLVDMGIEEKDTEILELLIKMGVKSYQYIEFAYQISSITRNNVNVQSAITRASKIVFALKHYTHSNSTGTKIVTDINDGIKTVLVLYHSTLKQSCEVEENFQELPRIACYPDELNQVWTNLIHNAVQSMSTGGKLIVQTERIDDKLVVRIQDNGEGIPADVLPRIFDRFFTTKPAGEGSGMGLDICQRIVAKHNGTIDVESEPGRTVFTVSLPIQVE